MSITMTLKRWAYLLMVVLPLLAVVLALCPTVAQAQETNHNNASADASAERLVVAPGDCLWSISEHQLGPGATPQQIAHEVELIYALNRNTIGADPNTIFVGQRLSLPPMLEHQAAEEPSRSAAPVEGEAARAPAMSGSTAGAPAERGSQQRPAGEQRLAGEAAAADIQEEANPATLPAVAGIAPVPTVRMVAGAPSALERVFALDGPYAERKLLGLGMMLVSLLIGAATLAWAAIRAMRRAAERRRRRRSYYPRAYGGAAYRGAYAPFIPDLRTSSSESRPSGRSRGEADRAAPSEGYRRPFALVDPRPRRARRLPGGDWGQKDHALMFNGRRQAMGVNPNVPDERNGEWEIDESLRRSLEALPLQPGAPMLKAVRGLKPHVEEALKSLTLLEQRRPLSENEHRQADTLRGLLMSIEHTSADNGRR